jgi:membrane protein implicated in regulation of membrane protease activity
MSAWVVWAIVAAICAGAEALTLTLILGFVSIGALIALIVAVLGAPVATQLIAFIVGTGALVGFVRPIAKAHLHRPSLTTGVDALVGKRAVVVQRVDLHQGQVRIGGEVWTARAYLEDQVLEPGTSVDVVKIQGATALVYGTE